jgi:hypothetical protein
MPLTEEQIREIEARWLPLYDVQNRSRLFHFDQYAPVDVPALIAELLASQAEARRLRAALAWYGEPRNYRVSSAASVNKIAWWPVVRDAGARARATLAPAREGT